MMYEIDTDTMELLEAALNCMVTVADAQINEEAADALMLLADELADRFGIAKIDTEVIEGTDELGREVTIIREVKPEPTRPVFRIIDGSKPDKPIGP
jgi:hypothetical protein